MNKFACQTPKEECSGGLSVMNNVFNRDKARKLHNSPQEAFGCHVRHLLNTGHERVGSKEFRKPDGSGGVMRKGKEGNRYMPKSGRKTTKNGLVVG